MLDYKRFVPENHPTLAVVLPGDDCYRDSGSFNAPAQALQDDIVSSTGLNTTSPTPSLVRRGTKLLNQLMVRLCDSDKI